MSTSKGTRRRRAHDRRGRAAGAAALPVPAAAARHQAIEFDPEGTDAIPRLFDEFDRIADADRRPRGEGRAAAEPRAPLRAIARRPRRRRRRRGGRVPAAVPAPRRCSSRSRAWTPRPYFEAEKGSAARPTGSGRSSPSASRRSELWLERFAPGARPVPRRDGRAPARGRARCRRAARRSWRRWRWPPSATAPQRRRGLAGADLRRRDRAELPARSRVRRHLRRVPGPPQRAAGRLAAGQPRAGVRARAGCARPAGAPRGRGGGRRSRRMSVGAAAAPRGAATSSARARSTRARTRRSSTARSRSTRAGGALSARATALKAERNTASKRDRRGHPGRAPTRSGPEVAGSAPRLDRRRRPDRRRSTPSSPRVEAELEELLLRIPNPPDPGRPGRRRGGQRHRPRPGASLPRMEPSPTPRAPRRRGPAGPTGSSARRSASSTSSAAPRSPAPASPSTAAPGSPSSAALIDFFLDIHTRENGMTEIWPPAVVNAASARGTGQIPDKEDQMYVVDARRPVPGPDGRGAGHEPPPRRDPRRGRAADPLRGLLAVLPARGRRGRQGHPRHPARPPVRQGRDGLLRAAGGLRGRARG